VEKRYLFTPGPTPVPPAVLAAGAEPIVHHRGADFRVTYASVLGRLKDVFRTESDVLLFTASGSGAMESAPANLCAPGDRVTVVSHGSFGERWLAICRQHELDIHAIQYEWGERPDPA
jgi:aspartate aminotransferase-like enzyme